MVNVNFQIVHMMGDARIAGKDCGELEALKTIVDSRFPVTEVNVSKEVLLDKFGQDRVGSSACFEGKSI